jgi:serine/threonine protein kinase
VIAGRYSLEREIGRGGSGVVWLARDEVLGRHVALKRIGLLPGADSTDLTRAEREARLSARLNHPHVVAVFDVVVDADSGAHWLVMEYVDGATLAQLVTRKGKFSPDDAAPLLGQVADALVAAHAAGIAHRDVKPSNILVDRSWQAKLTDFGIARIATDATLTQTGMLTGSPAYLAPEIALGSRSNEAADVWSLGATTFHALAGHPPYDVGDHVLGALYRIVNEEPPRLSDAGWMTPLLEGTMVRDPSLRWSMTQVRDFLEGPEQGVAPASTTGAEREPAEESTGTHELTAVSQAPAVPAPAPAPEVQSGPATDPSRPRRRRPARALLVTLGLVLAVALGLAVYFALPDPEPTSDRTASSPTPSPSPSRSSAAPQPTAEGMETFIRDYVSAVSADPSTSWQMLTPKFQQESGGFDTYRAFWDRATNGRVTSISTNPDNLTVSYQVRFDNFNNGPGPTVLDLVFEDGRFLIDGERTQGFVPAG